MLGRIREARYESVVTMDDDLQKPPEEISQLLAKLDEGHDGIYGTPLQGRAHPGSPFWPPSWRPSRALTLFALGIIGEYLARMNFRSMEQPSDIIQPTTALAAAAPRVVPAPASATSDAERAVSPGGRPSDERT